MKQVLSILLVALGTISFGQLTTIPDGGNKKAMVSQRIGITDVTIRYDRPGVKGREGKIWGGLVPFGFNDLGFGTSKQAPWRAGANESTTIEFSTDISFEGKPVPAGKYGFFIAVGKEESTLILSKNNTAWGSFFYDPKEDQLRVMVKQQVMDHSEEWLKYEFTNPSDTSAVIALMWEKWLFPFKIQVDLVQTQLASFRKELQTDKGFDWQPWTQAAEWAANKNVNLDEALQWADYGISGQFIGQKNFKTLRAKAAVLNKMGKQDEAAALMKEALPFGNENEVHNYARQLLASGDLKAATDAFKMNYKNHPNTFTTNMGMMRAMSANANYKEALKYLNAAMPQAPDPGNKSAMETMQKQLQEGKDVNKK